MARTKKTPVAEVTHEQVREELIALGTEAQETLRQIEAEIASEPAAPGVGESPEDFKRRWDGEWAKARN